MVWQIAGFLVAAGAVYGGIRGDLREMRARIEHHEKSLEQMTVRIDSCVSCPGRRAGDKH